MHGNMIAIASIIKKSHNYHFFLVIGIIKSLSKFDDYNTMLFSIFTVLCIRSLGLIYYSLQVCTPKQPYFYILICDLPATDIILWCVMVNFRYQLDWSCGAQIKHYF